MTSSTCCSCTFNLSNCCCENNWSLSWPLVIKKKDCTQTVKMKIYCMDRDKQNTWYRPRVFYSNIDVNCKRREVCNSHENKNQGYSAQEGLLEPRFTLHMDRTIIIYFNQFNFIETFKNKNKRQWNVWFRKFSFLNIYFINYYFFVDVIAWQNSKTVHLRCLSLTFSTTLCIVYTSVVLKQNRKSNKIQKYQCKTVDKNWKMIPSTIVNWEL